MPVNSASRGCQCPANLARGFSIFHRGRHAASPEVARYRQPLWIDCASAFAHVSAVFPQCAPFPPRHVVKDLSAQVQVCARARRSVKSWRFRSVIWPNNRYRSRDALPCLKPVRFASDSYDAEEPRLLFDLEFFEEVLAELGDFRRDHRLAVRLIRIAREVLLVIALAHVKGCRRHYFRDDRAAP